MDYKKLIFRFMYLFLLSILFFSNIPYLSTAGPELSFGFLIYLGIVGLITSIVFTLSTYGIFRGYIAGGLILLLIFIREGGQGYGLFIFIYMFLLPFLIGVPVINRITKLYERIENVVVKILLLVSPFIILFVLLFLSFNTCSSGKDYECIYNWAIEEKNVEICDRIPALNGITACYSKFAISTDDRSICYKLETSLTQGYSQEKCLKETSKDLQVDQKFLNDEYDIALSRFEFWLPDYNSLEREEYPLVVCYETNLVKDIGESNLRLTNAHICAIDSGIDVGNRERLSQEHFEGKAISEIPNFEAINDLFRANGGYSHSRFFRDYALVKCYESNSGDVQETIDCLRESKMYDKYINPDTLLGRLGY